MLICRFPRRYLSVMSRELTFKAISGLSFINLEVIWFDFFLCVVIFTFSEMSDKVRKIRGSFKEKLRELGGINAVFDVLVSCQSVLEVS